MMTQDIGRLECNSSITTQMFFLYVDKLCCVYHHVSCPSMNDEEEWDKKTKSRYFGMNYQSAPAREER